MSQNVSNVYVTKGIIQLLAVIDDDVIVVRCGVYIHNL